MLRNSSTGSLSTIARSKTGVAYYIECLYSLSAMLEEGKDPNSLYPRIARSIKNIAKYHNDDNYREFVTNSELIKIAQLFTQAQDNQNIPKEVLRALQMLLNYLDLFQSNVAKEEAIKPIRNIVTYGATKKVIQSNEVRSNSQPVSTLNDLPEVRMETASVSLLNVVSMQKSSSSRECSEESQSAQEVSLCDSSDDEVEGKRTSRSMFGRDTPSFPDGTSITMFSALFRPAILPVNASLRLSPLTLKK